MASKAAGGSGSGRPTQQVEMAGNYTMIKEIGKGSFAVVYKGRKNDTRQVVAIKAVLRARLNRKLLENLESEIQILKTLDHPHIVHLLDCSKNSHYIHLVMEFCSLKDLAHLIKRRDKLAIEPQYAAIAKRYPTQPGLGLHEVVCRHFIQQLASALKFLHDRRLIHRDIKPQNLLLNPPLDFEDPNAIEKEGFAGLRSLPTLKIADFGFARFLPELGLAETLCGSPLYMAPEILRFEKYDAKVDLWSVGAVSYEMLVGKPPFRAQNHVDLLRVIDQNNDKITFPEKLVCGDDLKDFIRRLLKKNPVERMGYQEYFDHPVITGRISGTEHGDGTAPVEQQRPHIQPGTSAPAVVPVSDFVDAKEYDYAKGLPTLPIAESTMPTRPLEMRRASTTAARSSPPSSPMRARPGRITVDTSGRTPSARELAVLEAVSTPLNEGPVSPQDAHAAREREREMDRREKEKQNSLRKREDERLVEDYVVIHKSKVEVNALADELAASPASGRRPSSAQQVTRRPSASGKELVRTKTRGSGSSQAAKSPTTSAASALAKAIAMANNRLFGFGGHSPPQQSSPFPNFPTTTFHTNSLIVVPSTVQDEGIVNAIEDAANKSDVVYHFAQVKFSQIAPSPSAGKGLGVVSGTSPDAGSDDDLPPDALYQISEESLVLYIKTLSLLTRAMDHAGAWWARTTAGGGIQAANPAVRDRVNAAVQWVRERFNEVLEKAEWSRMRMSEAQKRLPPEHPMSLESVRRRERDADLEESRVHPAFVSTSSAAGSVDRSSSRKSPTSMPDLSPEYPAVTAERLMYDRACEMSKRAAIKELVGEDLEGCRVAYAAAGKMLEAILDSSALDSGGGGAESETSGDGSGGGGSRQGCLSAEDRETVKTLIRQIAERNRALGRKIAQIALASAGNGNGNGGGGGGGGAGSVSSAAGTMATAPQYPGEVAGQSPGASSRWGGGGDGGYHHQHHQQQQQHYHGAQNYHHHQQLASAAMRRDGSNGSRGGVGLGVRRVSEECSRGNGNGNGGVEGGEVYHTPVGSWGRR